MSDTDREALDDLLRHPGWSLVVQHVRTYWTAQVEQLLATAANDPDDGMALGKIRQVIAAKRAVEAVIGWPVDRVRELATAQDQVVTRQQVPLSRRGSL